MSVEKMNSGSHIMSWVDALNHHEQSREPYVIATVIKAESPSSAKPGDKAIISEDGNSKHTLNMMLRQTHIC